MPGARRDVASLINRMNMLEYEAGKIGAPPPLRTSIPLAHDHPAQRPKGDRPVPFGQRALPVHERPRAASQIIKNPFPRRNSRAGSVESPRPCSRKAFDVGQTPPASPPRVMMHPAGEGTDLWEETPEQYITRKLTERWSPPHRDSAVSSRHKAPRPAFQHVDAPLVQDILLNIDNILLEHTNALRGLIHDSKRMLEDRELSCRRSGSQDSPSGSSPSRATEASVPQLVAAVDRTASHLGLSLSEQHAGPMELGPPRKLSPFDQEFSPFMQAVSEVASRGVSPGASSCRTTPSSTWPGSQRRQRKTSVSLEGRSFKVCSSPDHELSCGRTIEHAKSNPHLGVRIEDYGLDHVQPLIPSPTSSKSRGRTGYRLHWSRIHPSVTDLHPFQNTRSPAYDLTPEDSSSGDSRLQESTTGHAAMSPSPAIIEYDRAAALADRTSRDSITESSMGVVNKALVLPEAYSIQTRDGRVRNPQHSMREITAVDIDELYATKVPQRIAMSALEAASPAGAHVPAIQRVLNPPRDAWLNLSSEQEERSKFKMQKQPTLDRMSARGGVDASRTSADASVCSHVRHTGEQSKTRMEPITQSGLPIKRMRDTGKRQTGRMVSSLMDRQARDRDKRSRE